MLSEGPVSDSSRGVESRKGFMVCSDEERLLRSFLTLSLFLWRQNSCQMFLVSYINGETLERRIGAVFWSSEECGKKNFPLLSLSSLCSDAIQQQQLRKKEISRTQETLELFPGSGCRQLSMTALTLTGSACN